MELAKRLRPITREEVLKSYEDLKTYPCEDPGLSRVGTKTLDAFFFQHRLKAKTKAHISFYDATRDPKIMRHLSELVVRYKKKPLSAYKSRDDLLRAQYAAFQLWYGTINQFRPAAAKWVYCQLKPRVGILDFSAGWGGRALAAMSMGIPYYGFDANVNMRTAYQRMIAAVNPEGAAPIQMRFQPSETVDFSKYKYDLVFTSPPYFMLEEYEEMPAYTDKKNFLNRFFVPVIRGVWRHLIRGGHMALNMPEEMYEAVKDLLPPLHHTILLPLHNRHPTNAVRGHGLGVEDKERSEFIYVWKKGATNKTQTQTRKKRTGQRRQTRRR